MRKSVSARKDMCQCAVCTNAPGTELAPVWEVGISACRRVSLVPVRVCHTGQREKGKAPTVAGHVGFA